jgi:hypothetical protein
MKIFWTLCLAALAQSCAGQGSNRREAVIQDWIQKIREAPRGHSMSPSWCQCYRSVCLLHRRGDKIRRSVRPGNTKGGSITVPLTSCLTGLD